MQSNQPVSVDPVARAAEQQNWISPETETGIQSAMRNAFESIGDFGADAESFLHGEWLHEPLHAAVTEVPIGAWTATVAFDSAAALTAAANSTSPLTPLSTLVSPEPHFPPSPA